MTSSAGIDQQAARPASTRWRARFRLRTIFVVVAFCSIPLVAYEIQRRAYISELEIAKAIRRIGGQADLCMKEPFWWHDSFPKSEVFQRVVAVRFTDADLLEDEFRSLDQLSSLQVVELRRCRLSDSNTASICRSHQLSHLSLDGSNVDDRDLANFAANLRRLRSLDLSETQITDRGLVHLRNLADLRELDLSYTSIGDEGLEHVAHMSCLEELDIIMTRISSDGFRRLKKALPNVQIPEI